MMTSSGDFSVGKPTPAKPASAAGIKGRRSEPPGRHRPAKRTQAPPPGRGFPTLAPIVGRWSAQRRALADTTRHERSTSSVFPEVQRPVAAILGGGETASSFVWLS